MTDTKTGKDIGITEGPFADAPVISEYTDEQAVDDGVLVDIGGGHRVTRPLFEFVSANIGDTPPAGWPVALLGFVRGAGVGGSDHRALAALRGLADTHATQATKVYEENIDGGILEGFIQLGAGEVITGFDLSDSPTGDTKIWFIPNGTGITAMFPSDY